MTAHTERQLGTTLADYLEPVTICDACPEEVNPDARCTHGRDLCPECLTRCPECRDEFADDEGLSR